MSATVFPALLAVDEESVTQALGAVQTALEYTGTVAFAMSGAVLAGR